MKFSPTPLDGAWLVSLEPKGDDRGTFVRTLCMGDLAEIGHTLPIAQANHSVTRTPGAVRGMHYQLPPAAEIKIVRCLRGRVFDVIIDLRRESPTLLRWFGAELAADNHRMMYVPEGFAHGFQVLEPESELLYFHTASYAPALERGVRQDDPAIAIDWPLRVTEMSERDRRHPMLEPGFSGISL